MNLLNYRPVLFVALSLISGAVFVFVFKFYSIPYLMICSACALSLVAYAFIKDIKNKRRNTVCLVVCLLFFVLGATLLSLRIDMINNYQIDKGIYHFTGYVCSKVNKCEEFYYELEDAEISRDYEIKGVSITFSDSRELQIGDRVDGYATVSSVPLKSESGVSTTGIVNGPTYFCESIYDYSVTGNKVSSFTFISLKINSLFKKHMSKDTYPIAYAMMCGDDSFMTEEVKSVYRFAGIAHIFAVSGLHIGFLCALLSFLMRKFNNLYAKTLIISAILIAYSGICGFRPSSLRAVIMCITLMTFSAAGGKYDFISSISLSAIILLLMDIGNLFDVGFQLSYMAVVGIAVLYPMLNRIIKIGGKKLSSSINLSLSATISTLPVMLNIFGKFSAIGVLFNVLLVPIVSVLFYILFAVTVIGLILPFAGYLLTIVGYIINSINYILNVADLSIFYIGIKGNAYFALTYYIAFFIASDLINLNMKKKLIFGGIFFISSLMCLAF